MQRTVLSWSGGKDAALALSALASSTTVSVDELLTTVSAETDRSSMHGVRRSLYVAQADALGIPISFVELPESPSNEEYESIMDERMRRYHERGFDRVAFGDLALEDVRAYREDRLASCPVDGLWPLWGMDTRAVVDRVLDAGYRAIVVVVDAERLPKSAAGAVFDRAFLEDLPDGVDPAGESGEFHTFVVDGPGFDARVPVERGERVTREVGEGTPMHYCDLSLVG